MTRRGPIRNRSNNLLLVVLVGMVFSYWLFLKNSQGANLAKMREKWAHDDQEEINAEQKEIEDQQMIEKEKQIAIENSKPKVVKRKTVITMELDYKAASGQNAKIVIDMWKDVAPITAANFIALVRADFFDKDGHFYRAEKDFLLQGGIRPKSRFEKPKKNLYGPIKLEANYHNERGTIAMARTTVCILSYPLVFCNKIIIIIIIISHRDLIPQRRSFL